MKVERFQAHCHRGRWRKKDVVGSSIGGAIELSGAPNRIIVILPARRTARAEPIQTDARGAETNDRNSRTGRADVASKRRGDRGVVRANPIEGNDRVRLCTATENDPNSYN